MPWWDAFPDGQDEQKDPWRAFPEAKPDAVKVPQKAPERAATGSPAVVDGDTIHSGNGTVRLWGADAPELHQPGYDRQGQPVPVGQQSRDALTNFIANGPISYGPPQGTSYHRTVAPFSVNGDDAARSMVRLGDAFAAPQYVTHNPDYRFQLMQDQRLARQNGLGPINDNFVQNPADYRAAVKANPDYVAPRETVAQWMTAAALEPLMHKSLAPEAGSDGKIAVSLWLARDARALMALPAQSREVA